MGYSGQIEKILSLYPRQVYLNNGGFCKNIQQLDCEVACNPLSIIYHRGAQSTSLFLSCFQEGLGTEMILIPIFHPQMDGLAERAIQILEHMLRVCVIDFKVNQEDHLSLIEFTYNNSYHSSIFMEPFEALFGRRCRSPVGLFEVSESSLLGPWKSMNHQRKFR